MDSSLPLPSALYCTMPAEGIHTAVQGPYLAESIHTAVQGPYLAENWFCTLPPAFFSYRVTEIPNLSHKKE